MVECWCGIEILQNHVTMTSSLRTMGCYLLLDFLPFAGHDDVLRGTRAQARVRHSLEQLLHLRRAIDERLGPESVPRVANQLDEGDQETPRVGTMHDETLQKHASNLILDLDVRQLRKEEQEHAREIVRMSVRVPQVICQRRKEQIATFHVKLV